MGKIYLRLILFVIACCISPMLRAQFYSSGQDPASLRWRQIKTDRFRIIYPAAWETRAQYLARIMEKVCSYEIKTLPAKQPRIPIVLHTESSISNGLTVWAPKRIEFFPTPDPDAYAEEWLEQLAVHEYRHALQINKMNRGLTRALYYILGEQATGGILGAFIPTWFLEGDATVTETALTKTGRGRTGWFEAVLRAQLLEKGKQNFSKATLGSYKTFVPDAYELGYYLVGMGRKDYGPGLWDYSLDHVAKYPFMIVPFADGIKRKTGLSKVKWYKKTLDELDSIWRVQDAGNHLTPSCMITRRNTRDYATFTHPMYYNDSVFIAERSSNEDVDRFVSVDLKGREKKLFRIGAFMDGSNSLSGDLIAWAEYEPDLRWSNRNYAVIKLYDLKTRKMRHLTRRSRYFSPVLSHDGKMVVAVRVANTGESFLEVLSTVDGRVLFSKRANGSATFQSPDFTDDDKQLIYLGMNEKGKTISICNISTGRDVQLLPYTYTGLDGPSHLLKNFMVFSYDYTGIENLYAIDTSTHEVFRITSARFGAYDPDFNSDKTKILYSDYTADGLMISETGVDTSTWVPLGKLNRDFFNLAGLLAGQEEGNLQDTLMKEGLYRMLQDVPVNADSAVTAHPPYTSKKYSKGGHLFNVHSWAPVSVNASNLTAHPGIMALSQNVLSSAFASAGYDWNYNEGTGQFYLDFNYQGLFPVFDFRSSYGNKVGYYTTGKSQELNRFTWNELNFQLTVSVPLNFSRGAWSRGLIPAVGTSVIDVIHNNSTPSVFTKGWINTITYNLNYYQYIRSNYQDMYPRWGQDLTLTLSNSPFGVYDIGSIWAAQADFYFPGLFRHHGLWLYGGYQQRDEKTVYGYSFSEIIPYPRGYTNGYDNHLFSISANYKLPLFRPDWNIGGLLYFKRFKLNLFFDQAMGDDASAIDWNLPNLYQTLGSELSAELHFMRFVYPFELGVRPMYFPTNNSWGCQFIYSVSF